MTVPKSKVIANKKYRAKTYDTISFDVPKGKRDEYKQAAASLGLSLARFLYLAAEAFSKEHSGEDFKPALMNNAGKLSATEKKLVEEFKQLPKDAQKTLLKFLQTLNTKQPVTF